MYCDKGLILKLQKYDSLFKEFNIIPSRYKYRTYYLTNDDMLIYKVKKEEHPFVAVSLINNYNNYKYVISFFSRLPEPIHTLCIQELFKKENYTFETKNHLHYLNTNQTVEHTKNSMSFIKLFSGDQECFDYIENEGNFLINYLQL